MWIEHLNVKNCRLLKDVSLDLSPHVNLIVGKNASGKTSFLEALTLLSNGKSFRTPYISQLISHSKKSILVSSRINTKNGLSHIGIEKSLKNTKIRINKQNVFSQAELSKQCPITAIHPGSIELISGSPTLRRAYIDWIAFYLFPDFLEQWKKFKHVLKQRNSCLKNRKHRYALDKWTEELVQLQPAINSYRVKVLDLLIPCVHEVTKVLLDTEDIQLSLNSGFPKDQLFDTDSLLSFYKNRESLDLKFQRTAYGIHSSDVKIHIGSIPAKECASRGQLKLLVISLLLAQSSIINKGSESGILLIDDLAAELDVNNRNVLLDYLSNLDQQLILTSTQTIALPHINHKVFHVKHGVLS